MIDWEKRIRQQATQRQLEQQQRVEEIQQRLAQESREILESSRDILLRFNCRRSLEQIRDQVCPAGKIHEYSSEAWDLDHNFRVNGNLRVAAVIGLTFGFECAVEDLINTGTGENPSLTGTGVYFIKYKTRSIMVSASSECQRLCFIRHFSYDHNPDVFGIVEVNRSNAQGRVEDLLTETASQFQRWASEAEEERQKMFRIDSRKIKGRWNQ